MSHYKNGREARVGDIAVGTTYNRPGRQIGVIVGITPGTDSCDVRLCTEFAHLQVLPDLAVLAPRPYDYTKVPASSFDYTAAKDLLHIEDFIAELERPAPVPMSPVGDLYVETHSTGFGDDNE